MTLWKKGEFKKYLVHAIYKFLKIWYNKDQGSANPKREGLKKPPGAGCIPLAGFPPRQAVLVRMGEPMRRLRNRARWGRGKIFRRV